MGFHAESAPRKSDEGVSMVELLVYMLLAVVVVTIVASILINSLRVDSQVRAGAESADTAQLTALSLGQGIRNASAIEILNPTPTSTLLRTRSIDGSETGEWFCNVWHYANGELRWARSAAALPPAPDQATIDSWLLLSDGVELVGAAPIFQLGADLRSVAVSFSVQNEDGAPILLDTTMVSRQPVPSTGVESDPCWP